VGIVTDISPEQYWKAPSLMEITLVGILSDVNDTQ